MNQYTGVKQALSKVMGGKFKCLPTKLLSETECKTFIRAAFMSTEKYTVLHFRRW